MIREQGRHCIASCWALERSNLRPDQPDEFPPFTTRWVTAVAVATYLCIFALVIQVHEVLPSAPLLNVSLERAWSDLQTITRRPHPYNSHENDVVRNYLLQRVQRLAERYPGVQIGDDVISNATYVEAGYMAFYVEGSNILVKVLGRNATLPAVLFSAHFDSSATAPGATDDGIGVVSLLSLMEEFASNAPLRTAIFNLNNGEEDGLCGSHVFFQHPWSQEAAVFLNLEGAGAGGRPILFRASTTHLVKAFQRTKRPHGTVISSDAYALGLIKSQTDFEVYAKEGGLKGLDVSYYTNRDKYHTMADTVSSLNGQRDLWTGLQLARDVGLVLANFEGDDNGAAAVYWDVLGRRMVAFTFNSFVQRLPRLAVSTSVVITAMMAFLWYLGVKFGPRREWLHFPVSLLFGITTSIMLSFLYCKLNPLIVYSSAYSVITSIGASIILSTLLPLHILHRHSTLQPAALKSLIWSQYFIFMLVLQFGYIQVLKKSNFGGFYFLEWLYGGAALGLILDTVSYLWVSRQEAKPAGMSRRIQTEEADEVTAPLLEMSGMRSQEDVRNSVQRVEIQHVTNHRGSLLWTVEFALSIVPALILAFPLVLVLASGLGQTIADGSAPAMVYSGLTMLLFLCFIPLVPFAHRISSRLFLIIGAIFIASTLYNFVAFPFSKHRRVKFFYTSNLDLDSGGTQVELLGIQPYLKQALHSIPSANAPNAAIAWSTDPIRGLGDARWEGPMPSIANLSSTASHSDLQSLVTSTVRRVDAETAVFTVKGKDTKSCVIRFDQNIIDVRVKRSEHAAATGETATAATKFGPSVEISKDTTYSMPAGGVPIVTLWSRGWDTEFKVTVRWNSTASSSLGTKDVYGRFSWRSLLPFSHMRRPTYTGRIGCQWADNQEGQIKPLEELFEFLPEWATITTKKALLTADRSFSV